MSIDAGNSWTGCRSETLRTAFVLDLRFLRPSATSPYILLVGTSDGVYVGRPAETSSPGGCIWELAPGNDGFCTVNATESLKMDGEEFAHPVSVLHVDSQSNLLYAAISMNRGKGPAKPRGGDSFSAYYAQVGDGFGSSSAVLTWKGMFTHDGGSLINHAVNLNENVCSRTPPPPLPRGHEALRWYPLSMQLPPACLCFC